MSDEQREPSEEAWRKAAIKPYDKGYFFYVETYESGNRLYRFAIRERVVSREEALAEQARMDSEYEVSDAVVTAFMECQRGSPGTLDPISYRVMISWGLEAALAQLRKEREAL